jgi:hypothetical protein
VSAVEIQVSVAWLPKLSLNGVIHIGSKCLLENG